MKIVVFRGREEKSLCGHPLLSPMFNQLNPEQLSFNIIQIKFRPTFDFSPAQVNHQTSERKNTYFFFPTAN